MGQTKQRQDQTGLAELPLEPWGWQMKRAREEFAGLTLADAVTAIGRHYLTSTGSISRMEDSLDVPSDPRRRALACVAAVVYGLNPNQFGVGSSDLPPGMVQQITGGLSRSLRSTRWYGGQVIDLRTRLSEPGQRAA